jgi:DNA-3-methyladenine glycosylase II
VFAKAIYYFIFRHYVVTARELATAREQLIHVDPTLKELFDAVGELDFAKLKKPFYCALVGAIIGQMNSYKDAKLLRGKLYKTLGGCNFEVNDIEQLDDKQLSTLTGLSATCIKTIRSVNRYLIDTGRHSKDYSWSTEEAFELMDVPGIDSWTVKTTLLTSMVNVDIFPEGDAFVANRIQKLYKMDHNPTMKEVADMCKKWSPYRGVVAWYFWRFF